MNTETNSHPSNPQQCAWCRTPIDSARFRHCSRACAQQNRRKAAPGKLASSFWARTEVAPARDPNQTPCRVWTGAKNYQGYGLLDVQGRSTLAHRHAWILTHGAIPDGLEVCHECDNGPLGCVEPSHLFLGTHAENMADMARKGRSGRAKLTPHAIKAIRRLRAYGLKYRILAALFDITQANAWAICNGLTWNHVSADET